MIIWYWEKLCTFRSLRFCGIDFQRSTALNEIICLPVFGLKARPNGSNMLLQHHPTLLNPTCCTRLATMLHDVAWCWMMLNEVWFPSNIVFNIIQHFFCSQVWTKMLHSFGHRVQHCWTRACPLSWLAGICIHGNYRLFIVAPALPRGCKDTVWRMRKVSIHSAKIALAISRQIEKGKAKQLLKTGDQGNREDVVTRRSIDLSNYWKKDHVCGTYFVRRIMSGKREGGLVKRSKTNWR